MGKLGERQLPCLEQLLCSRISSCLGCWLMHQCFPWGPVGLSFQETPGTLTGPWAKKEAEVPEDSCLARAVRGLESTHTCLQASQGS